MECKINLDKLMHVISSLVEAYKKDSGDSDLCIPEKECLYWAVTPTEFLVYDTEKPVLGVGDLSDDWEFLEKMMNSNNDTVALMMCHAYPLLAYITRNIINKKIVPHS
jgi:hypothetical protein